MTSSVSAPITTRLPFTPSSVSVARQLLRQWMYDRGASAGAIEDARVVISELVANSVRHAQPLGDGCIVVTWCDEGGGVQLSVTDGGSSTRPRNVNAPFSAVTGRGMAIVEVLALRWWSEHSDGESTVHARLP